MKTITLLSVAIATSLATHLAFATPATSDVPASDCVAGMPAADGMMSGGKGYGKKDKVAKRQAKVAEILAKFDTNQDGQITQDEAEAKRTEKFKEHAEKVLERFDLNQDGQITLDEVQAIHTDRFTEIDTDANGFLSIEEFQKGAPRPPRGGAPDDMEGPPPMGPEGGTDDMGGPRKGPKGNHQPGMGGGCASAATATTGTATTGKAGKVGKEQRRQEHFNTLDSDGDGQISKIEFMADLPLFDKFDCDNNGVITQDDLVQGPCQVPVVDDSTGETSPPATPPLPVFDRFDCNQDGVVTTEELQQGPCEVAQPTTETTTTTETPVTAEPPVAVEQPVEEMPAEAEHGGGAPCSTCHGN
jgi:Ca2+-binding EF-hand superfamily protein